MKNFKIKKIKEQKIIGGKFRQYIDFVILSCCLIIAFNIHPSNTHTINTTEGSNNLSKMIYIFHDYEGNEYIMNDNIHGSSASWDYLFDNEVPNDLKGDEKEFTDGVSIEDMINKSNNQSENNSESQNIKTDEVDLVKDNQISIDNIMSDLGIDSDNTNGNNNENTNENNSSDSDKLIINIGDLDNNNKDEPYYILEEQYENDNTSLVIEKIENNTENENLKNTENDKTTNDENLLNAKAFTFIEEGRILPTLVSRNDLYFGNNNESIDYIGSNKNNESNSEYKESGITIIEDYADCMTPWGYKIPHGDSVLAYKQMDNAPDICNIERRFCWKGKLSGTYTQQGCSINKNYTYEQRGNVEKVTKSEEKIKGGTRQNKDGTVTVRDNEIGGGYVFNTPNSTYTDFESGDNIRPENEEVDLTKRPRWNCTTPRGEEVNHGQFVQAFKHANGFSDSPCEMQIRLCTMGELKGTYTESTCKTRDTSFIDRVNGSPSWKTYSKEKIEWVKKQIQNEKIYYENARTNEKKVTNSDALDKILYILDQN